MSAFSFHVTSYQGFEDEILSLRNRNRAIARDRSYLDWRYLGQKVQNHPEIFWIQALSGAFVGMASLIYRPYWIDDKLYEFMILGDISLDKEYRGTGLADEFFLFIKEHLAKKKFPCALVIPNLAAQKVLSRCGWHEIDKLVHYVLLLNPEEKIFSYLKFKLLSRILSKAYSFLLTIRLKLIQAESFSLHIGVKLNAEFDILWESFGKNNICLRDRSQQSLQWRYGNYPGHESFFVAQCRSGKDLVAYLIYAVNEETGALNVYDFMAIEKKYISGFIKLFVDHLKADTQLNSIRIIVNKKHPYVDQLKKIGFSPRKGGQVIQTFVPEQFNFPLAVSQWILTAGDKDV